jgi:predicted outer membrane repeat protein
METKQHLTSADYSLTVLSVSLDGCLFHGNSVHNKSGPIVNLIMTYLTVSNCNFTDNNGSALTFKLLKSGLNFHGDIRFVNNHADYGAALRVCEASLISLSNNTHIWFTNNTAFFRGGAVYTHQSCINTIPPCLFQPQLHKNVSGSAKTLLETLKLEFVDNSASVAGDAIYGVSKLQSDSILPMLNMSAQTGPSWVSSDPQGVCFCDDNEQSIHNKCHKEHPMIKIFPGARFNISMITVGQMNGSTPGSIIAILNDNGKDGSDRLIVYRSRSANINKCENMTLLLQSKRKLVNIHFDTVPSLTGSKTYLRSQSVNVTVSLKPCPIGFFKNVNNSCKCNPVLCEPHDHKCSTDLVCDINKQEISIHYHFWIGCLKNSSLQSCEFVIGHVCTYCNPESTKYKTVNVFHLDDQCLPGRTGVMCGACKSGLSQILEQFRVPAGCMMCSNNNLAFLIPLFLFSGVGLVIFLTIFNMTVTEGAINGLVFYSTVAYAHPEIFRTDQPAFLWAFISWLNLDLGFEICTYNGMTGYQYIWLSFGYIFCLICTQISSSF